MLRILQEKGIEITPDEATVMMLGIYEDTGNLTFPSTKEEDFMAAGYLVRKGANLSVLSNVITKELTAEQVFLLNDLIQSATRYHIHGIDVVIAQASVDRYIGDIAVLVHKLKDMENLDVLFVLVRMEDRVYLIGRSRLEEVNVAEIASEFGGGGHPTAASATVKGMTLIEAHDRLDKDIERDGQTQKGGKGCDDLSRLRPLNRTNLGRSGGDPHPIQPEHPSCPLGGKSDWLDFQTGRGESDSPWA